MIRMQNLHNLPPRIDHQQVWCMWGCQGLSSKTIAVHQSGWSWLYQAKAVKRKCWRKLSQPLGEYARRIILWQRRYLKEHHRWMVSFAPILDSHQLALGGSLGSRSGRIWNHWHIHLMRGKYCRSILFQWQIQRWSYALYSDHWPLKLFHSIDYHMCCRDNPRNWFLRERASRKTYRR